MALFLPRQKAKIGARKWEFYNRYTYNFAHCKCSSINWCETSQIGSEFLLITNFMFERCVKIVRHI